MTAATTDMGARDRAARKRSASSQLTLKAWSFMSPAMALLLSMTVVPTIYLVYYAFRHEDLLGPNSRWVGLDNFKRVLTDPNIWSDSLTTLQFVVLAVVVEMALGLLLALMLSRKLPETKSRHRPVHPAAGGGPGRLRPRPSACCSIRPTAGSTTTSRPGA